MPENDLEFFGEKDKQDMAYLYCVGGMTLTGVSLGALAGGHALTGGAGGLIWGLLTCKKIAPAVSKKLFSSREKLRDHEIAALLKEIHNLRPYISKKDAIKVLAYVRAEVSRNPDKYSKKSTVA